MTALEKDMEQWVDELEKQKNEKVFDDKVANAIANGEVEMSIKKNTQQENTMEWVLANWEWIMLGFYTLEKIVKLSPSKKDDIIFDAVIKPVWDKLPFGK